MSHESVETKKRLRRGGRRFWGAGHSWALLLKPLAASSCSFAPEPLSLLFIFSSKCKTVLFITYTGAWVGNPPHRPFKFLNCSGLSEEFNVIFLKKFDSETNNTCHSHILVETTKCLMRLPSELYSSRHALAQKAQILVEFSSLSYSWNQGEEVLVFKRVYGKGPVSSQAYEMPLGKRPLAPKAEFLIVTWPEEKGCLMAFNTLLFSLLFPPTWIIMVFPKGWTTSPESHRLRAERQIPELVPIPGESESGRR